MHCSINKVHTLIEQHTFGLFAACISGLTSSTAFRFPGGLGSADAIGFSSPPTACVMVLFISFRQNTGVQGGRRIFVRRCR
jgi:hypothetical protein